MIVAVVFEKSRRKINGRLAGEGNLGGINYILRGNDNEISVSNILIRLHIEDRGRKHVCHEIVFGFTVVASVFRLVPLSSNGYVVDGVGKEGLNLISHFHAPVHDSHEQDNPFVIIVITIKDKKFILKGLCDSGNLLTEPLTGKCVILVSEKTLIGSLINNESDLKKRYIPYHGVEKEGILKGIIPQKILVNECEKSAIIAPIENKSFEGYDALVPSSLI